MITKYKKFNEKIDNTTCSNCGAPIKLSATYCSYCGKDRNIQDLNKSKFKIGEKVYIADDNKICSNVTTFEHKPKHGDIGVIYDIDNNTNEFIYSLILGNVDELDIFESGIKTLKY